MNQFKHTPGPWQFMFGLTPESVIELEVLPANAHDGIGWRFKDIKVGDSNGRIIATIGSRSTSDGVNNEEFEANAKLIMCNPEMIEALILALPYVENAYDCAFPDTDHRYVIDLIKSIIEKTTK